MKRVNAEYRIAYEMLNDSLIANRDAIVKNEIFKEIAGKLIDDDLIEIKTEYNNQHKYVEFYTTFFVLDDKDINRLYDALPIDTFRQVLEILDKNN